MRTKDFFKGGRVAFECKGVPSFTLNVLARNGIDARKINVCGDSLRFEVKESAASNTEKILQTCCREYKIYEEKGIKKYFGRFMGRYGFLIGIAIAVFMIYSYTTLITDIYFEGNVNVPEEQLIEIAGGLIKTPSVYTAPDLAALEKELEKSSGIAYAKADKVGRRINVKIIEELPINEITDTQNPISITAKESGTITKVVTLRGTAAVKEGDFAERGAELISPYIIDSEGNAKPTRAMGIVEAKVVRKKEFEMLCEEVDGGAAASEIERRIANFKEQLKEDEIFVGSSFELKRLDKSSIISIYYEIITRIS